MSKDHEIDRIQDQKNWTAWLQKSNYSAVPNDSYRFWAVLHLEGHV